MQRPCVSYDGSSAFRLMPQLSLARDSLEATPIRFVIKERQRCPMLEGMVNFRAVLLFGPVLVLWSLGLWVALRSGLDGKCQRGRIRNLFENASQVLLRLMVCTVGMVITLHLIGYRLEMIW
jgi:hypothetical protein